MIALNNLSNTLVCNKCCKLKFLKLKSNIMGTLKTSLLSLKHCILLLWQSNKKIKNYNNASESVEIKKNRIVNSESKKYKYI